MGQLLGRMNSFGFGGRRQPSMGGTSRISREAYVRFCERLGVKFPGPTRRVSTSGAEMWTASYDRPLKDVFVEQDEIVRRVVTTLGLILRADQLGAPHWWAAPTDNLEAFDDWLHAYQYILR